ncbi:MAG TPA: long-chain fatty acid--CoA ligase [Steroidobacteraceae bacterium]|jgi:fatty-acyl-CoA synthase|nr:long-chain fatty acid--CoA ligase [Steroidobacteraceae bacterium]
MANAHFKFWPDHAMHNLTAPATNMFYNAEVSARRFPHKPFLVYYDTLVSFSEFHDEAQRIAGYLEQRCGIAKGDRVLLLMQNSPQFMIGYYGILRANAVVVPLNPMNLTQEILRYAKDCGANTMLVSQELYSRVEPLLESGDLQHVIVAAYSDYLKETTSLAVPDFITAPRIDYQAHGLSLWKDVLDANLNPGPLTAGPDDLCVMPYTSGTTGQPKGCMHTHRTVMHTAAGGMQWFALQPEFTLLAVAPMFHVTGMQGGLNGPLFTGNTMVLLPRWDREVAAQCVERYKVSSWTAIPTMIQDFFLNPNIEKYDLSSIRRLSGGGAAMPAAVAQRLANVGITYVEGYGLTETIGATHINPPHHPKQQCLGIPIFDTDARVIDPTTLRELAPGEIGEIIMHGPQVFLGYWNKPEDTAQVFIELDGKRFFRSGDLGRMDEDGYFFIVDRLKRMINASGYKVWPTEVESLMYLHPAVQEACIIGCKDAHRGETVKAVIVPRAEWRDRVEAQAIIDWCREHMAAYKVPRIIEFVDALPKSGSGKIMWRELQERENAKSTSPAARPS